MILVGEGPIESKIMIRTQRTSFSLVPFALCAIGISAFIFAGCSKKEEPPAPPAHAPESYMNDPVFRGKLADARKEQLKLVRERNAIAERMKAKIEAMKAKLKTDDPSKLKAELEKDPEWNDLHKQCTEANAKVTAQREKTLGTVRERLTPKKPVSK